MPVPTGRALPTPVVEGLPVHPGTPTELSHAWLGRADRVERRRAELQARGLLDGATPAELERWGAALAGTLRVPVVAIRYADVDAPFPVSRLGQRLFGRPRGDTTTLSAYWDEVSNGLLRVEGVVTSWVRLRRPASHYLPADAFGWGRVGRIGELRHEALARADRAIDFTRFDNDGPDGRPDSGDDDGYVDFVVFYYATGCGRDGREGGIWPHRGAMAPYRTDDRGASGEPILVTDYVVLPAQAPGGCEPAHVGVLAHETAHALGLPDLYDYDGSSRGIGPWGLMGTGSHASPHSPAYPAAWARERLGWVQVDRTRDRIPARVAASTSSGAAARVVRHDLEDGTGRYLLVEYRSARGSDRDLPDHGVLVWGVDPERAELGSWNTDERRPAVSLLARGGADGRVLASASPRFPARVEVTPRGERSAREEGARVRVTAEALPAWRTRTLQVATVVGGRPLRRSLALRNPDGAPWVARAGPRWLRLDRTTDGVIVELDPTGLPAGLYADSVELVRERSGEVLDRVAVFLDVAAPGSVRELAADVPWAWGLAVRAGELILPGSGHDALGLRPRPRLLRQGEDDDVLTTLTRLPVESLFAPAVSGQTLYVVGRAGARNFVYRVDPDGDAAVVGVGLADEPAYGLAVLPSGDVLVAGWSGRIVRLTPDGQVAPWADLGEPIYQVAAGPDGTVAAALFSGDVLRIGPGGQATRLETGFGRGRLVAVTLAPDGALYAAERGGAGRIIRLGPRPDGSDAVEVVRVPGAAFYGLAAHGAFLYALDLDGRRVLRLVR